MLKFLVLICVFGTGLICKTGKAKEIITFTVSDATWAPVIYSVVEQEKEGKGLLLEAIEEIAKLLPYQIELVALPMKKYIRWFRAGRIELTPLL